MRAGQFGSRIIPYIEGVFDNVVSGDPNGMNKELAGEITEVELVPNCPAIDGYRRSAVAKFFIPFRKDAAVFTKQNEMERNLSGTIS